ncbi:MAG: hypothetical protein ACKV22_08375 [Bryobacteraceae bacterium]
MPYRDIPGANLRYALISFDDKGRERTDDPEGGVFSRRLIESARQEKPTNIFLFSHGWKGDLPAAIDQYNRWIGAMGGLVADQRAMGGSFKPMWIGLHWPSLPWGEESFGGASFAAGEEGGPTVDELLEKAVEHFGGESVRGPLKVIFDAHRADMAAFEVPPEALAAYQELAKAIGFSASGEADGSPDTDGAALDPQAALEAENAAAAAFGGGGGFLGGIVSGLRQASFWMMKSRARTVGEQGMHQFIAALQNVCGAKIHLMGHSFGCVVVSSILGGPGGKARMPRPVSSAVLVQGAMSLWGYADQVPDLSKPGYFRNVLANRNVSGPIVTTQSPFDTAVGVLYPAAVGLVREADFAPGNLPKYGAIGTFGIQGTNVAEGREMLEADGQYGFQCGRIYNLASGKFIKKMEGASGAHSDIDGQQVAHAIWQAALVS